jgi:hypothetical protein
MASPSGRATGGLPKRLDGSDLNLSLSLALNPLPNPNLHPSISLLDACFEAIIHLVKPGDPSHAHV